MPAYEWEVVWKGKASTEADPFDDAIASINISFPVCKYGTSSSHLQRYRCAKHEKCELKYKVLIKGAEIEVHQTGRHSEEVRERVRQRHPPIVRKYIDREARKG
ncbi:hypothetical protein FOL47_001078, partial [Perkinsus chesapeaki]